MGKKKIEINGGFESKEEAAELGYIAAAIERVKDGRLLTLNSDMQTYSFADKLAGSYSNYKYTYDRLMDDYRCTGQFKVLSWVKNVNVEKYIKYLAGKN